MILLTNFHESKTWILYELFLATRTHGLLAHIEELSSFLDVLGELLYLGIFKGFILRKSLFDGFDTDLILNLLDILRKFLSCYVVHKTHHCFFIFFLFALLFDLE